MNSYGPGPSHFLWSSENEINWSTVEISKETPYTFVNYRIKQTLTVFQDKIWMIGGENNSGVDYENIWYSNNIEDSILYSELRPSTNGINSHIILNYEDALWLFGSRKNDGTGADIERGEIVAISEVE